MTYFLLWYLLLAVIGAAAFPLAYTLFPRLAGRGYAFARPLGLLLWGYFYWLSGSLGLLRNEPGALVLSIAGVVGLSVFALTRIDLAGLAGWWRAQRRMVLLVELLFLIAFGSWTLVRAMNPEITATEKPMELAFLNAILRSPAFPPNDPWLSGYSISYYYFGYVLIAMLAMLTSTPAGIAFNLGVAVVFGLSAAGAFGVVDELLQRRDDGENRPPARSWALLGPLYVLLVSNLEGFLELLHARGLFWSAGSGGSLASPFWAWLDLKDLVNPPAQPFSWLPDRFLWWWRASRVVNDTNLAGAQQEVIDEFPFFSFLLSDLHPHVLAIPFVLLAIGLTLNLYFSRLPEAQADEEEHLAEEPSLTPGYRIGSFAVKLPAVEFSAAALVLGALAFLNTWDFPIYVALFTGAYLLRETQARGWSLAAATNSLGLGALLGVSGIILYFPFYAGFSSQAGGILPNVINPTRGAHLWIMFGSLLVPLVLYFLYEARRERPNWLLALKLGFGVAIGLWALSLLVVLAVWLSPAGLEALAGLGAQGPAELLQAAFSRRLAGIGGWLTLAAVLSLAAGITLRGSRKTAAFAGLMAVIAALLIIGPEFFYLRDLFGSRMNTIFKFYYQAWILMSLAAAYATARVLRDWRGPAGALASLAIGLVLVMGLAYPVMSLNTKTNGFQPHGGLNLDGTLHGAYLTADDRAAVEWLRTAPLGTLVEAVGGSYSSGGRIATHSGQPAVLGWPFHQSQWRGGYEEVGSREADIARIYETGSWDEARLLLDQYGVNYIYVGGLEHSSYRVHEAKFRRFLPVLFEQGAAVIYGYTPAGP